MISQALLILFVSILPGERFVGEKLCYEFFVFGILKVGDACVSFEKGEEGYEVRGEARPNAFASNFTGVREVLFRTLIKEDKEQERLNPYRVERTVRREDEEIETVYTPVGKEWKWNSILKKEGKDEETSGVVPLPLGGGIFDDPLSAVYNFRSGAFGEKKEGETVTIQALTYDGKGRITLKLMDFKEHGTGQEEILYMVQAITDGDTLGIKFRDVLIWVGPNEVPLKGVIRGAIPILNITASLKKQAEESRGQNP